MGGGHGATPLSLLLFCQGICFIRTSRPENAIIYNNNEEFHVGQAKVSTGPGWDPAGAPQISALSLTNPFCPF